MDEQADQLQAVQQGAPARGGLELRIDELVLHGFRPADRHAIAAAVERELARLLAEQGLPGLAGDGPREALRLDAGSFEVPHDAAPDAVGAQLARAIHRGLGGAEAGGRGAEGARR